MTFILTSPAFRNGEAIPSRYAKGGDNLSPPLAWENPPPRAKSFVVLLEDPNAPFMVFHHWGAYDIPGDALALAEGAGAAGAGGLGAPRHAINTYGNAHYDGPQPPPLHGTHHYHFRLLALDVAELPLDARSSIESLKQAAAPHTLGEAQLIGTYKAMLFGRHGEAAERPAFH
jgi:hypothetical protein